MSGLQRHTAPALGRGRLPTSRAPTGSHYPCGSLLPALPTLDGGEERARRLLLPSACGQDAGTGTLGCTACAETHRIGPDPFPIPRVPAGGPTGPWPGRRRPRGFAELVLAGMEHPSPWHVPIHCPCSADALGCGRAAALPHRRGGRTQLCLIPAPAERKSPPGSW